ncbi:MAG: TonB-dependent receptor [Agarilytica sp.]
MKKTKLHLNPLAAAIALMSGTIALPQIAVAQEGAREEEEVLVVSARRRDESLQEVPISLSSFTGDALEKQGIQDITQIGNSSPNTTLKASRGSNTTLTAFIRGVGQQDPVAGFEAGVGIYIDDIYLNRPQGAVVDVYDVERVEILRGPQGTLYGRNTIGGAIKYVTKRLSDEPELSVKGTLGEYNQTDLLVTGSAPIGDVVKVGGSLAVFKRDGFGETDIYEADATVATDSPNQVGVSKTGTEENYDKDIFAGRVSLEITPSDSLYIRFAADHTVDNSSTRVGRLLTDDPTVTLIDGNGDAVDTNGNVLPLDGDGNPIGAVTLPRYVGMPDGGDLDTFDSRGSITAMDHPINENKVTATGASAFVEFQINDALTFKSTTAMREDETESPIDFDSLPGFAFDVPVIYENEQLSQEFQLGFDFDRVAGVVGLYYLDANAFNAFDVVLADAGVTSFSIGDVDTSTWALFGEASIDLTDTVELTVGGRFTEDERTATVQRELFLLSTPQLDANGDPVLDGNGDPVLRSSTPLAAPYFGGEGASLTGVVTDDDNNEVVPTFSGSKTDSAFTPKISIAWKPSDDANLYASYSQGFKGGGFDPRGNYSEEVVRDGFDPEFVDAYEVGFKSNAYDGQILSNLAFFYSDYTDVQIPGSIGVDRDDDGEIDDFVGVTTNAGKASIVGVEWDVTINFTDNLSAIATAGLIDAEFSEYIDSSGEDVSDERVFQNTPAQTGSLTLNYGVPVGPGELTITGNANYRSKTYQDDQAFDTLTQSGFTLYNLSAVWNSDNDHWQGGLHIQNLTDEEYIVAGYNFGFVTAFYGSPRQIFGTVKYNFF